MQQTDVAIVGGGIVGLATAWRHVERRPGLRVVVLEKESSLAQHQTGHNSGVLHSGVYYTPGSLRAINCRLGKQAMEQFCRRHEIPFQFCGKVIVAVSEQELPALTRIYERGQANQVRCELIGAERLKEIEPHVAGVRAIHVPEAGIVNYRQVCLKLAELVGGGGGEVVTGARVTAIRPQGDGVTVATTRGDYLAKQVVNCAGLHSDRVTRLGGQAPPARIVPFRGEYYKLLPSAEHYCRGLIYPVPDPNFPFLGVHFTRMIQGGVECGPNAVFAFSREGYRKRDINLFDLADSLSYPGFLKLAFKYWKTGAGEMWRSCSKEAFVNALRRLVPEIRSQDLETAPAGVRAQAISPDGRMVDDFLIQRSDRIVNVCNAPSPAATASLNIGDMIVDKLVE